MTRAKFKCTKVVTTDGGTGGLLYTAHLQPVTNGSKENQLFFAYTPYGSIEIGAYTIKDQFIPGVEYYVDFTPAVN